MEIAATVILLYWLAQGARLTYLTWDKGHSPIWVIWQGIATLSLTIPIFLIWR